MYVEFLVFKDVVMVFIVLIWLFCFFGVCKILISDNGIEFIVEVIKIVCRLF